MFVHIFFANVIQSFKHNGLPPRRSWFNLRKPAAEVDRVFAVSGGATLVSSHGVSWRNVPGIRAHFVSIDCVHHVSYISLSFINIHSHTSRLRPNTYFHSKSQRVSDS
jgi:hypothetical protein